MEPITMMLLAFGVRTFSKWCNDGTVEKAIHTTGKIVEGTAEVVGDLIEYAGEYINRVATLFWSTVNNWMSSKRIASGDVGTLLRERLGSGEYRVVCGVFNSYGTLRQKSVWECSDIDSEMRQRLANGNKITINL